MRPCVGCVLTRGDTVSSEMGSERLVRDSKMITNRWLEIARKNTRSVKDENEVAHQEEGERCQALLRKTLKNGAPPK